MVVDDHGSKFTPTRSNDSDVEFLILDWHNINKLPYINETSQNDSVSIDDASPSSNTSPILEGDPASSDFCHHQGNLNTDITTDILVCEPSKQFQKNHSNIIRDPKVDVQTQENSKVNYKEMIRHICKP